MCKFREGAPVLSARPWHKPSQLGRDRKLACGAEQVGRNGRRDGPPAPVGDAWGVRGETLALACDVLGSCCVPSIVGSWANHFTLLTLAASVSLI